jgi:tRNA(fMet)-specific endonuclease VapC
VVDTNTLIYYFRGEGRVAERMLQLRPGQLGVPTPVVYELEVGLIKSNSPEKRRSQLTSLLERVKVLPLDLAEAKAAGRIRASLEMKGTPIGPLDSLIAGIALHNGGTLVTRNVREFSRVEGLQVVNWY